MGLDEQIIARVNQALQLLTQQYTATQNFDTKAYKKTMQFMIGFQQENMYFSQWMAYYDGYKEKQLASDDFDDDNLDGDKVGDKRPNPFPADEDPNKR